MKSVWSGTLERKVFEKTTETREALLNGAPTADLVLYNYRVGYLHGLQEALRLAEEVDNEQLGYSNASTRSAT